MVAKFCPSVATFIGGSLIVLVACTQTFLSNPGIAPTLLVLGFFFGVCALLPRSEFNAFGRTAVALSGAVAALLCHVLISLFNNGVFHV